MFDSDNVFQLYKKSIKCWYMHFRFVIEIENHNLYMRCIYIYCKYILSTGMMAPMTQKKRPLWLNLSLSKKKHSAWSQISCWVMSSIMYLLFYSWHNFAKTELFFYWIYALQNLYLKLKTIINRYKFRTTSYENVCYKLINTIIML